MAGVERTTKKPDQTQSLRERIRGVDPKDAALHLMRGVGAVLPPFSFGTDAAANMVDTKDGDRLNRIGATHIATARDAIRDAQDAPEERREKLIGAAEQSLRTAYGFSVAELGERNGKTLAPLVGRRETTTAYKNAAEAALLIAELHEGTPVAETWAEDAKTHFEEYATRAERAATGRFRKKEGDLEQLATDKETFKELYTRFTAPQNTKQ